MQESISEGVKKQRASACGKYYTAITPTPTPISEGPPEQFAKWNILMYILSCNSARGYQIHHDYEQEAIWRYL